MTIYLDWNATSPIHPDVLRAMDEARGEGWANPSSTHAAGRAARRHVEDAREALGRLLKVSPRDVVFTGGGTEANHLALSGARWLVTSRIEHPSVVAEAEALKDAGARVAFADVTEDGVVTPSAVERALSDVLDGEALQELDRDAGGLSNANTPLVAVMAANHETGVIQPLAAIKEVCNGRGARLHVDAVQLIGRGDLAQLDAADSIAIAAHKFRGPKGVGALAFDCGWTPTPRGRGGAQERGLRPGTVDATAAAGLSAALRRLEESKDHYEAATRAAQQLQEALTQRGPSGVTFHGTDVPRLGHVLNFGVPGWRGDELVAALDLEGICVSSGSACSAGTAEPSSIIEAMLGRERATSAVRVSFGEEGASEALDQLIDALCRLGILQAAK